MSVNTSGRQSTVATSGILAAGLSYSSGDWVWVDSVSGAAGNDGLSRLTPKKTFAQGLALLAATEGDVMVLMNSFAETFSAQMSTALAGITVVGEGVGSKIATLTAAVDAAFIFSGIGVRLFNLKFPAATVASAAAKIAMTGAGATVESCTIENGVQEAISGISFSAIYGRLKNCTLSATAAAIAPGVVFGGAIAGYEMDGCTFNGSSYGWATQVACHVSGTATNFRFTGNTLQNYSKILIATGCKGYVSFDDPEDIGTGCSVDWTI